MITDQFTDFEALNYIRRNGLSDDLYPVMARQPDALTHYECVICGKDLFNKTAWFIELIDAWGDPLIYGDKINGGYVCSTTCLRKVNHATRGKP